MTPAEELSYMQGFTREGPCQRLRHRPGRRPDRRHQPDARRRGARGAQRASRAPRSSAPATACAASRDGDFVDLSAAAGGRAPPIADTPSSALGSTRDKPDDAYCERILDGPAEGRRRRLHLYRRQRHRRHDADPRRARPAAASPSSMRRRPSTTTSSKTTTPPASSRPALFVARGLPLRRPRFPRAARHLCRHRHGPPRRLPDRGGGRLAAATRRTARTSSTCRSAPFSVEQFIDEVARRARPIRPLRRRHVGGRPRTRTAPAPAESLIAQTHRTRRPRQPAALRRRSRPRPAGRMKRTLPKARRPRRHLRLPAARLRRARRRDRPQRGLRRRRMAAGRRASATARWRCSTRTATPLRLVDLAAVAGKTRTMPETFLTAGGNALSEEGLDYFRRLLPPRPDVFTPFV